MIELINDWSINFILIYKYWHLDVRYKLKMKEWLRYNYIYFRYDFILNIVFLKQILIAIVITNYHYNLYIAFSLYTSTRIATYFQPYTTDLQFSVGVRVNVIDIHVHVVYTEYTISSMMRYQSYNLADIPVSVCTSVMHCSICDSNAM